MKSRPRPIGGKDEDFCICGHHEMSHANYQGWPRVCNQTGCRCVSYVKELAAPVDGVVLPDWSSECLEELQDYGDDPEFFGHRTLIRLKDREKQLADAIAQRDEARKELDAIRSVDAKQMGDRFQIYLDEGKESRVCRVNWFQMHVNRSIILDWWDRMKKSESALATARAEGREEGMREAAVRVNEMADGYLVKAHDAQIDQHPTQELFYQGVRENQY
jgi:hypothetical protein